MTSDSQTISRENPRRARERERKVEDLLDAAGQVFAQKGFHNSSMEEIARTAEYATGALYRYFSSKEELYLGLLDRSLGKMVARTKTAADKARSIAGKLTAVIRAQIENGREDMAILRIFFEENAVPPSNSACWTRLHERKTAYDDWLGDLVSAGQREGIFHKGPTILYVTALQGMIIGLYRNWSAGILAPEDYETQTSFITQFALRSFCTEPPPQPC